jgi:hypothetical protein
VSGSSPSPPSLSPLPLSVAPNSQRCRIEPMLRSGRAQMMSTPVRSFRESPLSLSLSRPFVHAHVPSLSHCRQMLCRDGGWIPHLRWAEIHPSLFSRAMAPSSYSYSTSHCTTTGARPGVGLQATCGRCHATCLSGRRYLFNRLVVCQVVECGTLCRCVC